MSDKNALGSIFPLDHILSVCCGAVVLCHTATLYRPEKCAFCHLLRHCHCARCRGSSLFQFCSLLLCLPLFVHAFLWNATFIEFAFANIIFRLHKIHWSITYMFAARLPVHQWISHKSWIFILIKWTSHFSTEERAINTQTAYKTGERSTCFDRFQLNVESVFIWFNQT